MPGRRAGRGGRGRVTAAAGMLTGVAMRVSSPVLVGRSGQPVLAINLAEPLVSPGRCDEAGEVIERVRQLLPPRLSRSSLWRLSGDMALARGDRDAGGTRLRRAGALATAAARSPAHAGSAAVRRPQAPDALQGRGLVASTGRLTSARSAYCPGFGGFHPSSGPGFSTYHGRPPICPPDQRVLSARCRCWRG